METTIRQVFIFWLYILGIIAVSYLIFTFIKAFFRVSQKDKLKYKATEEYVKRMSDECIKSLQKELNEYRNQNK